MKAVFTNGAPGRSGPRSPVAAVLLNLTGLGFGYLYLGRWWRALVQISLTGLLIALGFGIGAADSPWVWGALFAGWVAWMAYDGWRQARRRPAGLAARPLRATLRPVIIAMLLIIALVAGYGQYLQAGAGTFAAGLAAHRRGDCAAAKVDYQRLTTWYQWTLSPDVAVAEANIRECDDFLAAVQFQDHRDLAQAIVGYEGYLDKYRQGLLVPLVRDRLAQTHFDHAGVLLNSGKVPEAIAEYALTLHDYPLTAAAQHVPARIIEIYNKQIEPYQQTRYCEVLRPLAYFASLSGKETRTVAANAQELRPIAMFACGLQEIDAGQSDQARVQLAALKTTYPGHPLASVVDKAETAGAGTQHDWLAFMANSATVTFIAATGVGVICAFFLVLPCAGAAAAVATYAAIASLVGRVVLALRDCLPNFDSAECKSSLTGFLPGFKAPARLKP